MSIVSATPLQAEDKYQKLVLGLKKFSRVAVAFSGGVDSTLLYYAARDALGENNVLVLHAVSELISTREQNSAAATLLKFNPPAENHLEVVLHPLTWPEFVANTEDRCYFCKNRMYSSFFLEAEKKHYTVLLDGSNVDDLKSKRPGFRAIRELGVQTPMLDVGLSKAEIRFLAEKRGLCNYDKPSNSCLATRIPEATAISMEKLKLVEKCESFLLDKGFTACRVRIEGQDAVVQLSLTDSKILVTEDIRVDLLSFVQGLGFTRVMLDIKPRP